MKLQIKETLPRVQNTNENRSLTYVPAGLLCKSLPMLQICDAVASFMKYFKNCRFLKVIPYEKHCKIND